MRIKRFEAPDNRSALNMVKEALGEDALILATRTISPPIRKNGVLVRVEVVAAVEYDQEGSHAGVADETASPPVLNSSTYDYETVRRNANAAAAVPDEILRRTFSPQENADPPQTMKNRQPKNTLPAKDKNQRTSWFKKEPILIPSAAVAKDIDKHGPPETRNKRPCQEEISRWREQLIEQITVRPPAIKTSRQTPAVLALVGPTGVGKTTTAAKLAAWYTLREGLRVTLVSMDCYRIGATDQLRSYAKIMRMPCEITLRKNDFINALERHGGQDVIIVDTAGKSPYDEHHIAELNDWFSAVDILTPYLVVSATSKKEDLAHIVETYSPLQPEGIMVAKLDETRAYAALCQQLAAADLPVACLCTGQKVPEDFLMASSDFLSTLFREGWQAATEAAGAA